MKTTMTIIPCDGSPETKREVEFKNDTPSYEELRALVEPAIPSLNGGHAFERVNVWLNDHYTDMFVDEVGVLKDLPRNYLATAIYRANWLRQHPETGPEDMPHIAGVAVLFSDRVWF